MLFYLSNYFHYYLFLTLDLFNATISSLKKEEKS